MLPNPSNSDLVGEARRLSEAATPGPWLIRDSEVWWLSSEATGEQVVEMLCEETNERGCRDAEFIARARTLLPELAQQLEQAREVMLSVRVESQQAAGRDPFGSQGPPIVVGANAYFALVEALDNISQDEARAALTPDEGAEG
jgi:hypothetical protein